MIIDFYAQVLQNIPFQIIMGNDGSIYEKILKYIIVHISKKNKYQEIVNEAWGFN